MRLFGCVGKSFPWNLHFKMCFCLEGDEDGKRKQIGEKMIWIRTNLSANLNHIYIEGNGGGPCFTNINIHNY